jgi:hypothetical protein
MWIKKTSALKENKARIETLILVVHVGEDPRITPAVT